MVVLQVLVRVTAKLLLSPQNSPGLWFCAFRHWVQSVDVVRDPEPAVDVPLAGAGRAEAPAELPAGTEMTPISSRATA